MTGDRILIVEDDPYIAEAVGVHLELSGYEHTTLDDGRAAAEHLRDVMLPGLDGFQLMEPLRAYGIPVLYLSAKADVPSRVHGLRLGAEDYLVKPFEMIELLVRMEKILSRTGRRGRTLRYRDIEIDTENRIVTKGGAPVALQPLEFDLLAMLVRFKNCTLSRERLLNEIWGMDYLGARTVDTHIAMLRKKLDLGGGIVAVTKVGYRLED